MPIPNDKPKPPVPGSISKLDPPVTPESKRQSRAEMLTTIETQLQRDIMRIADCCRTQLRGVIHQYLRCVHRSMAWTGDSEFPRAVNRAAANYHAGTSMSWSEVLLFHIGDAILSYYNLVHGNHNHQELAALSYLHDLAECGLKNVRVCGEFSQGFQLMDPKVYDQLSVARNEPVPSEPKTEEAGDVPGGSGDSTVDQSE